MNFLATSRELIHIDSSESLSQLTPEMLSDFTSSKLDKVSGYITNDSYGKINIPKVKFTQVTHKTSEKGDKNMSENNFNDILFNDLKSDIREREERTRREISEREQRFEKQLEKFAVDAASREERISEQFKEREERITTSIEKLEQQMQAHFTKMESMKTQNFWGILTISVAFIVGVAAMIITLLVST